MIWWSHPRHQEVCIQTPFFGYRPKRSLVTGDLHFKKWNPFYICDVLYARWKTSLCFWKCFPFQSDIPSFSRSEFPDSSTFKTRRKNIPPSTKPFISLFDLRSSLRARSQQWLTLSKSLSSSKSSKPVVSLAATPATTPGFGKRIEPGPKVWNGNAPKKRWLLIFNQKKWKNS